MERNRCTDPAGRGYCGGSRGEERTAHQFNIVCGDRETGMVRFITWGPQSLPSVQSINPVKDPVRNEITREIHLLFVCA